jgi:hypothetical protein
MKDDQKRPNNREVEDEMVREPDKPGKAPKPATEPAKSSDEERGNGV